MVYVGNPFPTCDIWRRSWVGVHQGWNLTTIPWHNGKYRTFHCSILLWIYGPCVWSQTTILTLHRESFAWKWDMVLVLKFRTLDMVLGACDVVQWKNVWNYTIMFVYGAHETSLCPLNTTKCLVKGIFVMWSTYDGHFDFSTLRIVIITLDMVQG